MLNGRRIRTKIDTLVPSIPHLLQGRQSRQSSKHSNAEDSEVVSKVEHHYTLGDPCYALYFGPRSDRDPRWVHAIVTKVHGTRSVNVRVIPRGPTWRRHLDQLDLDTVRIKMMIPVKSQQAFCLQKHFQPGLTTHLVLLRTNATIRDYQPETSTGDTIHDDQQGPKDLQKNIVANMYIFFCHSLFGKVL